MLQDYGCITKAKVDPRELMRHMIVVQKVYKHCTSATRRKIVSCLIQCVHATSPVLLCVVCPQLTCGSEAGTKMILTTTCVRLTACWASGRNVCPSRSASAIRSAACGNASWCSYTAGAATVRMWLRCVLGHGLAYAHPNFSTVVTLTLALLLYVPSLRRR